MPDDHSVTISSSSLTPDAIMHRSFRTVRKGFDPNEVRAFLEVVGRELRGLIDKERELLSALTDAERRAANPVLDDATLTAALGQEAARVLSAAHDAAKEVLTRAEEDASRLRSETEAETAQIRHEALGLLAEKREEAEMMVAELRSSAEQEAHDILETAREEAALLRAEAQRDAEALIAEAKESRVSILSDLSKRRQAIQLQIEQLRAARDSLIHSLDKSRQAFEESAMLLNTADETARQEANKVIREAKEAEEEGGKEESSPFIGANMEEGEPSMKDSPDPKIAATTPLPPPTGEPSMKDSPDPKRHLEDVFARLRSSVMSQAAKPRTTSKESVPEGSATVERLSASVIQFERHSAHEAESTSSASNRDENPSSTDLASELAGTTTKENGSVGTVGDVRHYESTVDDTSPAHEETEIDPTVATTTAVDEDRLELASQKDDGSGEDGSGEEALLRRNEALDVLVTGLVRKLKRILQDIQNELLDNLRVWAGQSSSSSTDLLVIGEQYLEQLHGAASAYLTEAANAGARFFGYKDAATTVELSSLCDELARAVADPLKDKLDELIADSGDQVTDESNLADQVSAIFRDWKGDRLDEIVTDHLITAFSMGSLSSVGQQAFVRWIVDDGASRCPDCDDNALAGALPIGESFPTGHAHPPAHAGCRCLLVLESS
ncbi:MAG: DivIVA domain-containing protein [Actinobacteria bacterium]|nr:DivIVA domain-containing protein [Actinomycetota bacterium]